jgi:hypothetical protein
MWFGYTDFLAIYYNAIVKEWVTRGFEHKIQMSKYIESGDIKDFAIRHEAQNFIRRTGGVPKGDLERGERIIEFIEPRVPFAETPWWWKESKWRMIDSHREALLKKDPKHYGDADGPCGYWVHQRRNPMPTEYWWPYGEENQIII